MTLDTKIGAPMSGEILRNYINSLIGRFFKVLPLKESGEDSLNTYIKSLQAELLGCKEFIIALNYDPSFMSLIAILQHILDTPECSVKSVKRYVFSAISICNKLKARYAVEPEEDPEV